MEQISQKKGLFKRFTYGCVNLMQKYLPDPFIFCAILTFVVFIGSFVLTKQSFLDITKSWGKGFWSLLSFSMQMVMVLVAGHAMASSPLIKRFLHNFASKIKGPKTAIVIISIVSAIACVINWGFGLVIGALFAKEIAKKVKGVDYRLLIASAYSGFLLWHGGFSGSIPLQIATGGEGIKQQTAGIITEAIPVTQTLFSPLNIFIIISLLILLPVVNYFMFPHEEDVIEVNPALLEEKVFKELDKKDMTAAEKIENSRIVSILLFIIGFVYIVNYFINNGFDLNLNIVNLIFVFAGIILHGTPRRYLNAIEEAVKGAGGIILQYPFYAGIMGMMVGADADGNSLAVLMSNFFVNISTPKTFPLFSFISAGIVNFFVPSGGGQWVVQAPIVMPAGQAIGVSAAKSAMAIAWGDAWTNMIQPFWALPALGIAGLGAKDIMGYCVVVLLASGFVICLGFLLF